MPSGASGRWRTGAYLQYSDRGLVQQCEIGLGGRRTGAKRDLLGAQRVTGGVKQPQVDPEGRGRMAYSVGKARTIYGEEGLKLKLVLHVFLPSRDHVTLQSGHIGNSRTEVLKRNRRRRRLNQHQNREDSRGDNPRAQKDQRYLGQALHGHRIQSSGGRPRRAGRMWLLLRTGVDRFEGFQFFFDVVDPAPGFTAPFLPSTIRHFKVLLRAGIEFVLAKQRYPGTQRFARRGRVYK